MSKVLSRLEQVSTFAAIASTFLMVCLTVADAGGRYLLNRPVTGAYEITEKYLMVFSVFFAMGFTYREGAHIRVTFLVDRLPEHVRLFIKFIVQIISILLGVSLILTTAQNSVHVMVDGLRLSAYGIPLWPAYLAIPVGLFFMTLRMFLDLWQIKKGKSSLFKEDSSATSSPTNG